MDLGEDKASGLADVAQDEDETVGRSRARPVLVAITPKAVVVWLAITIGALLVLALGYLALDAISWVFVAALFAMALNPAVEALVQRGLRRGHAAAVVFFVAFAAIGALGFLVVPPLITATTDFVEALPGHLRQLDAGRGLAALTQGPLAAVIVVVVLLVYQQIENHVLLPVVYGRTVDLSPLAVVVALLVGAELAGVLGALAAIPVGGSIAVVAREVARWRRESSLHLPESAEQLRRDEPT